MKTNEIINEIIEEEKEKAAKRNYRKYLKETKNLHTFAELIDHALGRTSVNKKLHTV